MSHTNPYRPPEVADLQLRLAGQVFARRAPPPVLPPALTPTPRQIAVFTALRAF